MAMRRGVTGWMAAAVVGIMVAGARAGPVEREVAFEGVGGFDLKGTLLMPEGVGADGEQGATCGAMLLLPGSGPTDRDGNQRPYLVTDLLKQIAERLAGEGVATFRFDKRAVRTYAEQWPRDAEGFNDLLSWENFVGDARAAYETLLAAEGIDRERVGLMGHSEGGLITLQLAHDLAAGDAGDGVAGAAGSGTPIAGIVLIGTSGRTIAAVLPEQVEKMLADRGVDEATNTRYMDYVDRAIAQISKDQTLPDGGQGVPQGLEALFNPTVLKLLHAYFTVEPAALAAAYGGPVLIVQGRDDVQVSAERDTPPLEAAFRARGEGAGSLEVVVVPGTSHCLKAVSGEDDPGFEGPVVEGAMEAIVGWVKREIGQKSR